MCCLFHGKIVFGGGGELSKCLEFFVDLYKSSMYNEGKPDGRRKRKFGNGNIVLASSFETGGST